MPYIVYQERKGKRKMVLVALQNDSTWIAIPTTDRCQSNEALPRHRFNKLCKDEQLRKEVDKAFAEAKELSVKIDRASIIKAINAVKKR